MRNPVRRSRNMGKTQGGRVIASGDGRACEKWSRHWGQSHLWLRLSVRETAPGELRFIRQNPSREWFHPCDADDYRGVLAMLPRDLTEDLRVVVMPRISKPHAQWGVEGMRSFRCILMNPFPADLRMRFGRKLTPNVRRHYAAWCDRWARRRGQWELEWEVMEVRRYYLFHVFLHELGHINEPGWISRAPSRRREEFAEDFALSWARSLGQL